jgi:hypothetical protein
VVEKAWVSEAIKNTISRKMSVEQRKSLRTKKGRAAQQNMLKAVSFSHFQKEGIHCSLPKGSGSQALNKVSHDSIAFNAFSSTTIKHYPQ